MSAPRRDDLPLRDYAVIGDGLTAALVARDGSIDWLCHGRFDGPAVLCRLLDREKGGYFAITPQDVVRTTRGYAGATNVLATEHTCTGGRVRVTDFMPLGRDRSMVLRKIEGLQNEVELRVVLRPSFDFARRDASFSPVDGGCITRAGEAALRLSVPARLELTPDSALASLHVREGETRWVFLTSGEPPPDEASAAAALEETLAAWERWTRKGHYPEPYAAALQRSALLLKLLIHAPTGAMIAAPTTSLPEAPGGERNWDYRFMWLRDASWVVSALMDLHHHDESMAFIDRLESLELARRSPAVFYDLDGRVPDQEQELWHLSGYRGSRPVRVGNAAAGQDQHDIFAEVVAAIFLCSDAMPSMRPLRPGLWKLVSALTEQAIAHWSHADCGIWEVRGAPQHYLSSKLLSWMAIDRALSIARRDGLDAPIERWSAARAEVAAVITERGVDPATGAFTRVLDGNEVDASALLLPRSGFLPAADRRVVQTVAEIRKRLGVAPDLLLRYRADDGLEGREGAFLPCSFWLVDCLARQGRVDEAQAIFGSLLARANDVGLLSEELDPRTGALLGNYPQALTHLALIRAAVSISEALSRDEG